MLTHAATERGFTLVELIVTMVLASIVFGVVGMAVVMLLGSGSQSNTQRLSASRASAVFNRFEQDVRYAQSPEVLDHPRSGDDLRNMLLWGQSRTADGDIVTTTPDECNGSLDVAERDFCMWEDITVASATELWVRSDVRGATSADDGTECVVWDVRSGALWRTVYHEGPAPDCRRIGGAARTGAEVESQRMLDAPPSGSLGNSEGRSASFGYLVVWNPNAAAVRTAMVDPKVCASQSAGYNATLTGRQRTFVQTVTLDLAAYAEDGRGTSTSRNRYASSASLLGRATDEFARASGCAY